MREGHNLVETILLGLFKYLPNWTLAIAALSGMSTWKKKVSHERKMSIVDEFFKDAYDFILKKNDIMDILSRIEVGIRSHEEIYQISQHRKEKFVSGLHEFIVNFGSGYSSELSSKLMDLPIKHLYVQKTKITALKMKNNNLALDCYTHLYWFYDVVRKTATKLDLGKTSCWDNPVVIKSIEQLKALNLEELEKSLCEAERLMVEFSTINYK